MSFSTGIPDALYDHAVPAAFSNEEAFIFIRFQRWKEI